MVPMYRVSIRNSRVLDQSKVTGEIVPRTSKAIITQTIYYMFILHATYFDSIAFTHYGQLHRQNSVADGGHPPGLPSGAKVDATRRRPGHRLDAGCDLKDRIQPGSGQPGQDLQSPGGSRSRSRGTPSWETNNSDGLVTHGAPTTVTCSVRLDERGTGRPLADIAPRASRIYLRGRLVELGARSTNLHFDAPATRSATVSPWGCGVL